MRSDKISSNQRYFKLAKIVKAFDDPIRAIEILLKTPQDSGSSDSENDLVLG